VGLGGISMSGLAQLLRSQGHAVGGSDRQLTGANRDELFARLKALGVRVWHQNGVGVQEMQPAAIVYSSAVESGNPDLRVCPEIPQLPRARALAAALNRVPAPQIAVAGSCGKTTVTGWVASALHALGDSVLMLCGGVVKEFEDERAPGNFLAQPDPDWVVYEVDESDGSLIEFVPDYGVLLNIGTDHFERDKLGELFGRFLARCRRGVVLPETLRAEFTPLDSQRVAVFAPGEGEGADADVVRFTEYSASQEGVAFAAPGLGRGRVRQFGRHSAANAVAVLALLRLLRAAGDGARWFEALSRFQGVRQRFELIGQAPGGATVYNDYAHNVEKIRAAIRTAQELSPGRVLTVFQPHGYGPLGFMRTALQAALRQVLRPRDRFAFLPVYYAGGTTSFQPQAEDVAGEFREAGLPVDYLPSRADAASYVRAHGRCGDTVLLMGARDPSLPAWTRELTRG